MFIRIIKKLSNNIEVWIMKDNDNGILIYDLEYFGSRNRIEAKETIKKFLFVMTDFRVVWLQEERVFLQTNGHEMFP